MDITKNKKATSKRIMWVDIAKGLAILLMVIGHELRSQSHLYILIFSFHMPLFFILSGYTARPVTSWTYLKKIAAKLFYKVCLLATVMIACYGIELSIFQHMPVKTMVMGVVHSIVAGSNAPGSFAGVMWFLYVYFWARLLFSLLQMIIKPPYLGWLLLVAAAGAMWFSHKMWLPQALDIAPVAAFFMWTGSYWRKLETKFNRSVFQSPIVLIVLAVFWLALVFFGIYIELSVRHYPLNLICVFEAVAGTVIFSLLSHGIELTHANIIPWLQYLGKQTLVILCIHDLDLYWVIWSSLCHSIWIAMLARLVVDLILLYVVYLVGLMLKRVSHK